MVRGLAAFKEHFAEYSEHYVLIGGAAVSELMRQAALDFRSTRDLDIVLIVEALTADFVQVFWQFIEKGRYQGRFQSPNERKYYRFDKPENELYPECIELFSRIPDSINFQGMGIITPIPMNLDISSLSAIILEPEYYNLIAEGSVKIEGISCLKPEYIIILKAKAWLDMNQRKLLGGKIDTRDIKKHRNDILKLFTILDPGLRTKLKDKIKRDLNDFMHAIENDNSIKLKSLNIKHIDLKELLHRLKTMYGIE